MKRFTLLVLVALFFGQCKDEDPAPVEAFFSLSSSIINEGQSVNFVNNSKGIPTSIYWEFDGGNPSLSNEEDPVVSYFMSGVYKVSLSVENSVNVSSASDTIIVLPVNDLQAYYSFTNDASDETSNGFDGTVIGAFKSVDSECGESVYTFDGFDDYIDLGGQVGNNIRGISLWFKPANTIDENNSEFISLISRTSTELPNVNEFNIAFSAVTFNNLNTPGKIIFIVRDENDDVSVVYSESNIWQPNTWYHVVAVIDETEGMKLFIDGILQNDNNSVGQPYTQATGISDKITTLGTWGEQLFRNFEGSIDEVKIYKRSLKQNDVDALFKIHCFQDNL